MTVFDQSGEIISQANRRGAQIGLLSISHPDIEKFIHFKGELNPRNKRLIEEYQNNLKSAGKTITTLPVLEKTLQDDQLTHFNISVLLTDEFMKAVENDSDWNLISPLDNRITKTLKARDLLKELAEQAWKSGDPGVLFYDRINKDNMVPYIGDIDSTNPCGEIPLLPNEACCLGSINLVKFYSPKTKSIDFESLEYVIRKSIRFMDDIQEVSSVSIPEINNMCKGLRRLGLGIMGFADLLSELDIPYGSEESIKLSEYLSWFLSCFSWLESIELAKERGAFPLYDSAKVNLDIVDKVLNSKFSPGKFNMDEIRKNGIRNVSVTALAPTGSLAILANSNSVIEPYFALAYKRNITQGVGNIAIDHIIEINSTLFRKLEEENVDKETIEDIKKYITKNGSLKDYPNISNKIKQGFLVSSDIAWIDHIKIQSAWQKYITNAVSKSINCPNETSVEDIYNMLIQMWKYDLKGSTVYRNGSKLFEILNINNK
jgi:ribonucleoside-diphosphate reductase alpha chain